ncbi:apoptosis-stimulating of p53 protein 1 [Mytilus galloprovincialis]|uniref:Apoptosis-stimulating of p53 protein 1 n=1 Tax=Mytilus galloprovincialis TaxID=29158 RepID=A0A8B6CVE0_MYTGA|nr:apoptosis-stimulating of p53 protein 1 [Mytilus galloprovincialis]
MLQDGDVEEKIILKVHLDDSEERCLEFPVNPDSTCEDVLACVQESGEGPAILTQLANGHEHRLGEHEKLYEILSEWEHDRQEVKFFLRHDNKNIPEEYTDKIPSEPPSVDLSSEVSEEDYMLEVDGQRSRSRNGMRGPPSSRNVLPGGVDLTLTELQDMAARQQHQIESQQQVLVAKEQRLKFLKQQEQKQQQITVENERLKKLRDKIETQEMKLRKLRELRGEVEKQQSNNGNLNSELDSVKALFTEKEKELVMAVAKVEQLTQQLEEIKKERANQKNGEKSAAAIELEKLKQELMLRNKMNEQQNSKLNAHREMLSKRKEEVSKMDNRIQELQQRLKKKKAQQAEQHKQMANQNKGSNRPIGSNIAAIEPYLQYSNKQENGDIDLKSEFAKQDPKYQTLPTNTKFALPEKSKISKDESKEQNNNTTKQEQMRIPLSVNVNSDSKSVQNGFSQNQLSSSIIKAAQRHQSMSTTSTTNSISQSYSAPPPIPARAATTNLTYLAPRPFGTTYSTNVLTNRIHAPVSSVNVNEEVRTSGSGQSSPASSEGSQKELPHDMHGTLINDPLQPTGAPTVYVKHGQENNSQQKSHDQVDSSRVIGTKNKVENGHSSSKDSPPNSNSGGSDNSLNNGGTSTNISKQPLRYASKNLIANTYMGRLGPEAMKKYQQNFNMLYSGDTSEKTDNKKDSETKDLNKNDNVPSQGSPLSPTRHGHQHPQGLHSPGSPHYTDIASDKVSHNRNTPRTIRRRHSDSENEDMTKLLHKYNVHSPQHQQNAFNFNNMQHETQATSFMDQIPEKVPVDDLGNLVDVQMTDEKNSDSNTSSSISPVESPKIEQTTVVRRKKTNLKHANSIKNANRVSFDPLALLLDASLEGELELVKRCASQVANVSESNDEGITALHNAICAGHYDIVTFLVEFGCDVNSPDSDGWTPLHCAASCNNLPMVKFLVEHGACIFATTISDQETAAEKCEEEEEGFDNCSDYLYSIQEKLGILNNGAVYAVFDYDGLNSDELSFTIGDEITVLKKGDEHEKEWWWSKISKTEGYIPRNLVGLYPRVLPDQTSSDS